MNLFDSNKSLLELIKDTTVYGSGIIISKSISFLIIPFVVNHFGVLIYGEIDTFQYLILWVSLFFGMGITTSIIRFFHEFKQLKEKYNFISQCFFILIILIIALIFSYNLFLDLAQFFFPKIKNLKVLFKLIYFQVPFIIFFDFSLILLKIDFKKWEYLFLVLGQIILFSLIVLVGISFNFSVEDYFKATLFVNALFSVIGIYFIREYLIIPNNIKHINSIFSYSFPFLITGILTNTIPLYLRGSISREITSLQLGNFALAVKLSFFINAFSLAFNSSWIPFAMKNYQNKDIQRAFNRVLTYYSFVLFFVILLSCIFLPLILHFFFEGNYLIDKYFFVICMSSSLFAISSVTDLGILLSQKSKYFILTSFINLLVTIFFIYFFIQSYEIYSIVIGSFFGQLSRLISGYIFGQQLYKMNWSLMPVFKMFFITVLFGSLGIIVSSYSVFFQMSSFIIGLIFLNIFFFNSFLKKFNFKQFKF